MLRGSDLIIRFTVALFSALELGQLQRHLYQNAIHQLAATMANAEMTKEAPSGQPHPALLVDTKYWISNTEFSERDNWRNRRKPCTLLERIKFLEQSVVSMGDSMDALESNIRELMLPLNGILLLEEDTFGASMDPMFVQYLNELGDCVNANSLSEDEGKDGDGDTDTSDKVFYFEPESDKMSWFNPANWASTMNEGEINQLIPESHSIPCGEDIVIFGDRYPLLGATIEANERSKIVSFKVNFRSSQAAPSQELSSVKVNNLRVSRLKIGNQTYNQREFEKLTSSSQYENILFEFNNSLNVLKAEDGFAYSPSSLLLIDESSIQAGSTLDFCLDEAGCLCGNENTNVMQTICSFNYQLDDHEQPCHDPIISTGYCNKICATVITISMDPTKFSEKFVASLLNKLLTEDKEHFNDNVFTGTRRTSDNKYEITFRHEPSESSQFQTTLGREREFAHLVFKHLNADATRIVYGINSIVIRSSVDWKLDNTNSIFWISFSVLSLAAISVLIYQDGYESERVGVENSTLYQLGLQATNWLVNVVQGKRFRESSVYDESESFVRYNDPVGGAIYSMASPSIPLVEMDSKQQSINSVLM